MCSTLLVEIVEYYVSNNSTVHVLIISSIDASKAFDRLEHSKAFDRLEHSKLFEVPETYNVCPLVRRLVCTIYSRSEMHVQWNSAQSTPISLYNGVKQGECFL